MKVTFSGPEMYSIAEAEIDGADLSGHGGAVAPQLWLALRLSVSEAGLATHEAWEVFSLTAKLRTNAGPVAEANLIQLDYLVRSGGGGVRGEHHYLVFPLDLARVTALERLRAGGGLRFHLDVEMRVRKLHALHVPKPDQPSPGIIWGHLRQCRLYAQTEWEVSRELWVTRVLPNVGYGTVHLLELPAVPVEACQAFGDAFKALKQAEDKHRLGFYDDAVGKCRVALEQFFEHVPVDPTHPESRKIPKLKKSWETRLGKATYEWLSQALGAVKGDANRPHHSPHAHYSQLESQMILAVTTALVAYSARAAEPEPA